MAFNQPPDDELRRALEAEQARHQFGGIPILGQPKPRRWRCKDCGEIPPVGKMQRPDGVIIDVPQSFATQLPEESGAVYLCMGRCWTNFQREHLGHLIPIDEEGNPIPNPHEAPHRDGPGSPKVTQPGNRAHRRQRRPKS